MRLNDVQSMQERTDEPYCTYAELSKWKPKLVEIGTLVMADNESYLNRDLKQHTHTTPK